MSVLHVKDLSVSYGEKHVLKNINIHVEKHEIVTILGASGVGKTTLFQCVSGLLEPSSGHIMIDDVVVTNQTGHVSYMLQKDLLFEHKTVLDNAGLPLILQGKSKQAIKDAILPLLTRFGLENTDHLYPHQLSGGMRQRVAFLRTFMMGKELALLDEPFSALDTITRSQMQTWYLKLSQELGLTTLFVTHDIDEAILLSDRILILSGQPGQIVKEVVVDVPKPRNQDFLTSDAFVSLKKAILEIL